MAVANVPMILAPEELLAALSEGQADRFGIATEPRRWFVVALPVIYEVIRRIKDEGITDCI